MRTLLLKFVFQVVQSFEKQINLVKNKAENNTVVIHSVDETPDETFQRLQQGLQDKTLTHKEIVDSIFNVVSLNVLLKLGKVW